MAGPRFDVLAPALLNPVQHDAMRCRIGFWIGAVFQQG